MMFSMSKIFIATALSPCLTLTAGFIVNNGFESSLRVETRSKRCSVFTRHATDYLKTLESPSTGTQINEEQVKAAPIDEEKVKADKRLATAEAFAAAADLKVQGLQKKLDDAKAKYSAEIEKMNAIYEDEKKSLLDRIRGFADQFQREKLETHKKIMMVKSENDIKVGALESTIENIQKELIDSQNELKASLTKIEHMKDDVFQLDRNLEMEQQLRSDESKQAQEKVDILVKDNMKQLAQERTTAANDLRISEEKNKAELEQAKQALTKQLMDAKIEAADQLQSSREEARRNIEERDAIINAKNEDLLAYEAERVSLRKLAKQSLKISKERVKKIFRK
uniref:Uncharacterized protein n=2 Tax=Corethron hystrix TaxID=216773 RepID=A0A6U5LP87_9STRA|mmetsp:Transcript_6409/g.13861  ORF Transcript_6409/g.13861 Transcript_6409/m.13861 type:complete len:338 (+) Transcript_6409:157-1170(+)|eukprot:CAMPEP_0113309518 /NCGR_PEP_ID=MMETSP0010_2-20120614/7527_1 /TAXON_ID=216773 ORGANISM="Corethron hystrix, Strain 308" /NCGR_SAMPLE_ID=MMETSP0010_2 /ASSEMBLY_ACC=CAM_ASM_000155 /LENGTH=337 /DNA_ID=CAMNT_0000164781 /DNA_START=118 /DNA_END=1131 /DNA_ORIENTATION=+ /assembly_acc=CAM_ASM_000155